MARSYYNAYNLSGMRQVLQRVLRIQPQNQAAAQDLALLGARAQSH